MGGLYLVELPLMLFGCLFLVCCFVVSDVLLLVTG